MANFQLVIAIKLATIAACGFTSASGINPWIVAAVTHAAWSAMEIANERSVRKLSDRFNDRKEETDVSQGSDRLQKQDDIEKEA